MSGVRDLTLSRWYTLGRRTEMPARRKGRQLRLARAFQQESESELRASAKTPFW